MGLDNGIIIKSNKKIKAPFWVKFEFFNNLNRTSAEVCYWRKCWGLRNQIIIKLDKEAVNGMYKLTIDDVLNIREILRKLNNSKNWHNLSGSIWEWDNIKWLLVRHQMNLFWLAQYMKKNSVEVYFYDSY